MILLFQYFRCYYRILNRKLDLLIEQNKHTERKLNKIMATQAEQAAKLSAVADQLDKATAEILAAIQALKDAQANAGNTTPEEDAATARLSTAAQALDDINPDAPAPTP
jgi:peptidoglycan hydrolase CwlO-like protein